jgi:pyridinium-3,5-biscarboxylic acid mononucleotide synthase
MDEPALRRLLDQVRSGALSPDDGVHQLRRLPFADLGYARVDHHRALRQGLPEAVYAPGKTAEQCLGIVAELLAEPDGGPVVLSRADPEQVAAVLAAHPGGLVSGAHGAAGGPGATVAWRPAPRRSERVVVATAGTADLPVAEECRATLAAFGVEAELLADVGVAGLHRLLSRLDVLERADAVVVVAGMEGALASVVGGLTACPVVAVPTSVGYGASLEGVTALLAMLAGCAAGVVVTGIDNGFGAAHAVARLIGPRRDGLDGPADPSCPDTNAAESSGTPGELTRSQLAGSGVQGAVVAGSELAGSELAGSELAGSGAEASEVVGSGVAAGWVGGAGAGPSARAAPKAHVGAGRAPGSR